MADRELTHSEKLTAIDEELTKELKRSKLKLILWMTLWLLNLLLGIVTGNWVASLLVIVIAMQTLDMYYTETQLSYEKGIRRLNEVVMSKTLELTKLLRKDTEKLKKETEKLVKSTRRKNASTNATTNRKK